MKSEGPHTDATAEKPPLTLHDDLAAERDAAIENGDWQRARQAVNMLRDVDFAVRNLPAGPTIGHVVRPEGPFTDADRIVGLKPPRAFVIGDVVALKSGGPAMVITELSPGTPPAMIARVVWTDEKGAEHMMTLDTRCLE